MLDTQEQERFCLARRTVIESEFAALNPEQRKAVLATEGPLLVLAGAGSGKTTVLIHRVANLLKYGRGSDCHEVPAWVTPDDLLFLEHYAVEPDYDQLERANRLCRVEAVHPWSILAITFTNKAAGELKQRLERMIGPEARDVWASTFHSCCARILRRNIDRLGYDTSFTIYDADDSERVVKDSLRACNLDDKLFAPRMVLGIISKAKDAMKLAHDFAEDCAQTDDFRLQKIASVYVEYENRLRKANALDFDDLILQTVLLLKADEEVRTYYQHKFRYVLVDEYQDTSSLQCQLVSLLAGGYQNLCVVGDDDQSIYSFRGATVENILSFDHQYESCRTIRLEQNYRSTRSILKASNAVIRNNKSRKGKTLWTEQGNGEKISLYVAEDQEEEAQYVAARMVNHYTSGGHWKDCAVLYRMNAQSREIEMALKSNGVPYKIIGGVRFFERAEVKDMLSYLCVIHNPTDNIRLQRIINNPPRGIGPRTVNTAQILATQNRLSLWEVISDAEQYPELQKAAGKLSKFVSMIETFRQQVMKMPLLDFYHTLCVDSGYTAALETAGKDTMEGRSRLENVQELGSSIQSYVENALEPSLAGFLDEIALYTDLDSHDSNADCVVMMTIHSAKGLEFPMVFLVGVEEGIFPGLRVMGDTDSMEEERRLCYVAMTRAKDKLVMTCANHRMLYGRTSTNPPSRFVDEIPGEYLHQSGGYRKPRINESDWRPERQFYQRESRSTCTPILKPSDLSIERLRNLSHKLGLSLPSTSADSAQMFNLHKGQIIIHKAFGRGVVLKVTPIANDALLEVAFDGVGTKRLMRNASAKYTKVE